MSAYRKPNTKKPQVMRDTFNDDVASNAFVIALQAACDAFNAKCPVGGKVMVKLDGVDEPFETVTRSTAQILSGHSAVVWMENVSGCYMLDRVTPIEEPKPEYPPFNHTRAALLEYDVGAPVRNKMWEEIDVDTDVDKAQAVELEALNKVREAFYLDTKEYNNISHCMRAPLSFMRQCADGAARIGST